MNPKLFKSLVAILFVIFCLLKSTMAQIAIHDANTLGAFSRNNAGVVEVPITSLPAMKVLSHYYPNFIPGTTTDDEIQAEFSTNPFLRVGAPAAVAHVETAVPGSAGSIASTGNGFSGFNASNIIVGYVDFVIKRAKQELNIAFFRDMKEKLKEFEELSVLYPATSKYLTSDRFNPVFFAQDIDLLQDLFIQDLNNIHENLPGIFDTNTFSRLASSNPEARGPITIAKEISKLASDEFKPATLFAELAGLKDDAITDQINLTSALVISGIISESLRDKSGGTSTWADNAAFTALTTNPDHIQIYLGLLYQQIKDLPFNVQTGSSTTVETIGSMLTAPNVPAIVATANTALNQINATAKTIETEITTSSALRAAVLAAATDADRKAAIKKLVLHKLDFSNDVTELLEGFTGIGLEFVGDPTVKDKVQVGFDMTSTMIEGTSNITKNIFEENWALLMLDVMDILEPIYQQLDEENSKAFKYIVKYGKFAGALANATSPEDAEKAIEAVVLPVGSASIKKHAHFNISLQTYIGSFGGMERFISPDAEVTIASSNNPDSTYTVMGSNSGSIGVLGVTLPVGLALSWGLPCKNPKNNSSISIFVSAIDFGAVGSFRLGGGDANLLPKFKIENFLAPGAYVYYGIPRVPLSIGAGAQYGPGVRNIEVKANENGVDYTETTSTRSWRFGAALVVDIPLFNVYNRNYRKAKFQ